MVKQAVESAKLWEARYEAVEKSRQEYRENTRKLITENESLHGAVHQVRSPAVRFYIPIVHVPMPGPRRSGMQVCPKTT